MAEGYCACGRRATARCTEPDCGAEVCFDPNFNRSGCGRRIDGYVKCPDCFSRLAKAAQDSRLKGEADRQSRIAHLGLLAAGELKARGVPLLPARGVRSEKKSGVNWRGKSWSKVVVTVEKEVGKAWPVLEQTFVSHNMEDGFTTHQCGIALLTSGQPIWTWHIDDYEGPPFVATWGEDATALPKTYATDCQRKAFDRLEAELERIIASGALTPPT